MNLVLLCAAVLVSMIVVRIGAIAFQLTGLEWSLAKFQALSCFTATGFTTKEAEFITGNPQRRRIASVLMILGHAGLVTIIATFANSLNPSNIMSQVGVPFLRTVIPSSILPWLNLAIIGGFLYAMYKIFTNTRIARILTETLRSVVVKQELVKRVSFEELLVATGGYGVSQLEILEDSPIRNRTLRESGLRKADVLVLVIERNGGTVPNPPADTKILLGDRLICFGRLETIRRDVSGVAEEAPEENG
jgi:hypothetical protein